MLRKAQHDALNRTQRSDLAATLRWPRHLTTAAERQIAEMAGAGGGDPGFYWRIRLFARLDALEEILHMRDGAVTEAVLREDRVLLPFHAFAVNGEAAAVDL